MQVSNLTQLAQSQNLDSGALSRSRVGSPHSEKSDAVTRSLTDTKTYGDSYERGDRLGGVDEKTAMDSASFTETAGAGRSFAPKTGDDSKSGAVVDSVAADPVAFTHLGGASDPAAPETGKAITDSAAIDTIPRNTKSDTVVEFAAFQPVAVTNLAGASNTSAPEPGKAFTDLPASNPVMAPQTGGGLRTQTLTDLDRTVAPGTKPEQVVQSVAIDPAGTVAGGRSLDEAASVTNQGSSISRIRDMVNDLRRDFVASAILAYKELQGANSALTGTPGTPGNTIQEQLIEHLESLKNQSPPEPTETKTFLDAQADHQRQAIDAFVSAESMTESGTQFTSIA